MGLGGQRLFILPTYDAVVVFNAGLYKSDSQDEGALDVLISYVLPALDENYMTSP